MRWCLFTSYGSFQSPWQSVFFQTRALGSRAGVKCLLVGFYYPLLPSTIFLLGLSLSRCSRGSLWSGRTHSTSSGRSPHPRDFLLKTQKGIVKGELALWRITVVGKKPPLERLLVAKIHCEALIRCANSFGFVDIRVGHIDLALVVNLTGAVPGLNQRGRHFLRILFPEPALPKPFLVDIGVFFQEVRGHWLVLLGLLLQFLQLFLELFEAWLCPKKPGVLPRVSTTHVALLGFGDKLGDQVDLPVAQDRVTHEFSAVSQHLELATALLLPILLFVSCQEGPRGAAPAVPSTGKTTTAQHFHLDFAHIVGASLFKGRGGPFDKGHLPDVLGLVHDLHASWQTWRTWCSEAVNLPVTGLIDPFPWSLCASRAHWLHERGLCFEGCRNCPRSPWWKTGIQLANSRVPHLPIPAGWRNPSRHSDSVCYKFHGKSAFVGRSPSKASEHRNYCAMFWARISEHFKSAHFGDVN